MPEGQIPFSNARNNSEGGRNQAEVEENSAAGKGYLAQAVGVGQVVVGYGIETGKWMWLKLREASARVMRA